MSTQPFADLQAAAARASEEITAYQASTRVLLAGAIKTRAYIPASTTTNSAVQSAIGRLEAIVAHSSTALRAITNLQHACTVLTEDGCPEQPMFDVEVEVVTGLTTDVEEQLLFLSRIRRPPQQARDGEKKEGNE